MRGSALWLSVCLLWLSAACTSNRGTNIDDPYAISHGNECSDGRGCAKPVRANSASAATG